MGKLLRNFLGGARDSQNGEPCADPEPLPELKPRPEKRSKTLTLHLTPTEFAICQAQADRVPVGEWGRAQLMQNQASLTVLLEEVSAIWMLLLNHPALSTEDNFDRRMKVVAEIRAAKTLQAKERLAK